MEGCATDVAAISWFNTLGCAQRRSPAADALLGLGGNLLRAAGDAEALHDGKVERRHWR